MPYTVEILKRAEKFLRSVKDARLYRRLRETIDSLGGDPHPPGSKKLVGALDSHPFANSAFSFQVSDFSLRSPLLRSASLR